MEMVNFFGGAVLLFFGLIIRVFKASGLIAGYNTSSRTKKAEYNVEKLTRFVGNMLMVSAAILLLGGLIQALTQAASFIIAVSWALFILNTLFMAFFTNTKYFKKQNQGD